MFQESANHRELEAWEMEAEVVLADLVDRARWLAGPLAEIVEDWRAAGVVLVAIGVELKQ